MTRRPHAESLARIPLVRHLLDDSQVTLAARGIDERWARHGLAHSKVVGFNPTHSTVYYPRRSAFAKWLGDPHASARRLNEEDVLVDSVLFAVHDYLHAWAYLAIGELAPELGFGHAPITRENIEALVFCHLATEAAAIVGLDYWYLSTVELNEVCPIGTGARGLAVRYHERDLPELRRFNRRFTVQRRSFFTTLASFYLDGEFPGFSVADAKASPKLMRWLSQEVLYGDRQREYVRRWLAYLSATEIGYRADQLTAPVASDAPWQRRLLGELGELLWEKVKQDKLHRFSFAFDPTTIWRSPEQRSVDFSFVNANRFRTTDVRALESGPDAANNFDRYMDQFISQHVYDHSMAWAELLAPVRQSRNTTLLRHVFRGVKQVPMQARSEPRDLFFLN